MATFKKTRSVAVLSKIPDLIPKLSNALPTLNFLKIDPETDKVVLEECEVLVADNNLLGPHIYSLPKIKWVQGTWAGVDNIFKNLDPGKPYPVYPIVRFTGPFFGRMMAEYVVSQLVNVERNSLSVAQNQQAKIWRNTDVTYRVIADMNIGVLGIGNIGKYIAQVLYSLGAKVWGLVRVIPETKENFIHTYRTIDKLKEGMMESNAIVNVLPHTEATQGLLDGGMLLLPHPNQRMVFINIGRGSIASEASLLEALDQGHISHAVLDVFQTEPLPETSLLWSHPRVTITPHTSGITRATDVAAVFKDNYNKWLEGKEFSNKIDFKRGY